MTKPNMADSDIAKHEHRPMGDVAEERHQRETLPVVIDELRRLMVLAPPGEYVPDIDETWTGRIYTVGGPVATHYDAPDTRPLIRYLCAAGSAVPVLLTALDAARASLAAVTAERDALAALALGACDNATEAHDDAEQATVDAVRLESERDAARAEVAALTRRAEAEGHKHALRVSVIEHARALINADVGEDQEELDAFVEALEAYDLGTEVEG